MPSDTSLTAFYRQQSRCTGIENGRLAVHMTQLGFKQRVIQSILGVPSSFISTWKKTLSGRGRGRFALGLYRVAAVFVGRSMCTNPRVVSHPTAAFGRRVSRLYPNTVWRGLSLVAKLLRPTFAGSL